MYSSLWSESLLALGCCPLCETGFGVVIFFCPFLRRTPRPHPTPRKGPETDPKRTRNRPETDPNGPKRTRNAPKRARNGTGVGRPGEGLSGGVGVGVVREKENHYFSCPNCVVRNAIAMCDGCGNLLSGPNSNQRL